MPSAGRRLIEIDGRQRRYLWRAAWHLARARCTHAVSSTRTLLQDTTARRTLIGPARQNMEAFDPECAAWAIAAAARYVPWRADCLIQALAASAWLRAKGYTPDVHLGVARTDTGGLRAHAWLTLDGRVILGGEDGLQNEFVPLITRT